MKSKITKEQVKDRIIQLVFISEVNLECCKIIGKFFNRKKETFADLGFPEDTMKYDSFLNTNEARYLTLTRNNHFCEAVSIVHSLLKSKVGKYDELSLKFYECNYLKEDNNVNTKEFTSWLDDIIGKYENEKFKDIRDKICAHKDINSIGDPLTIISISFEDKWTRKLEELLKLIRDGVFKFFKEYKSNNYLMNSKWGLKSILNKLQSCD